MVTVYYKKRMNIKSVKERDPWAKSGQVPNAKLPMSSGCVIFLSLMYDNIRGILPTWEAHLKALMFRVFTEGSLHGSD